MASSPPGQRNRRGGWALYVPLVLGLVGLWVGRQALHGHRVNWDGLAAAAAAYRVLYSGPQASLSEIGFERPPLPALMMTAAGSVSRELLQSGAAGTFLGIVSLIVAATWVVGWMLRLGLADWIAGLLVTVIFLHPLVVSLYVGGSPSAHFFTLTLIGLGALAMWMAEMRLRDLITASVALGLAGLCDHLGLVVAAAATVAVAVRRATGGEQGERGKGAAEGTALLFAMVPAYFYGLWVLAGWAIVGRASGSWHEWVQIGRTHLADMEVVGFVTLACGGWLGAAVLGLAVKAKGLRQAARHTVAVVAVAAVGPLALTAMASAMFEPSGPKGIAIPVAYPADWATVAPVAMLVKAAVLVVLALVVAEVLRGGWRAGRKVWRIAGVLILVVMGWGSIGAGLAGRWPASYADLMDGRIGVAGDYAEAQSVARLATWLIESKQAPAVYVSSRMTPTFAVALAAGDVRRIRELRLTEVVEGAYWVHYWPGGRGKEKSFALPKQLGGWEARFVTWWGEYAVYRYVAMEGGR